MLGPAVHRLRGGIVLAAIMMAAGCAPQPPRPPAGPPPAARAAEAQWLRGEDAAAARAWEALAAQSSGPAAQRYRLRAARAWLAAGSPTPARHIAEATGEPTDPAARAQWRLLRAELAWADGDGAGALAALHQLDRRHLDRRSARQAAELEARALEATGRPLQAARVRSDLDPLLDDAEAIRANAEALWRLLGEAPMSELHNAQRDADPLWRGWLELALVARSELADVLRLRQSLAGWQSGHPGHPAAETVVPALEALSLRLAEPPSQVALLLPLEGPFATAGRAVRNGVLAAWYATPADERPLLRIYTVTPEDAAMRAAQAVADGARFIIGPLQRPAVDAVVAAQGLDVPVLTLNRASTAGLRPPAGDEAAAMPRYQFGLPPEEEAAQVADRAWFDGGVRAAVLAAGDAWGERIRATYEQRWSELGGEIASEQRHDPASQELAPVVERLLLIDASRRRARALSTLLGRRLHSEPRPRQDLDCILLAARPTAARQIRPLLDFYRLADTPVYATSHVYVGLPDPVRDRDLRAVLFGDMPWVLAPRWRESPLQRALLESWPGDPAPALRLFALGIDAWRAVPELGRLRLQPGARLEGASGVLSVDGSGLVHRRLTWARFVDGLPRLVEE